MNFLQINRRQRLGCYAVGVFLVTLLSTPLGLALAVVLLVHDRHIDP